MLIPKIFRSLFITAMVAISSHCDEWTEAEVKSFRLVSERIFQFEVRTMQCAGAPCSATIYYVVESAPSNWPSHSISELKQFQGLILTAMSNAQKIKVNFSWNGYWVPGQTSGNYFLNWVELLN